MMYQKQNVVHQLRQEQVMTHHQIQALEFLSSPAIELESMINNEVEKNPVLDIEFDGLEKPNSNEPSEDWLETIIKLDENARYIKNSRTYASPEEEERRNHFLESIETKKSLQDILIEQIRFLEIEDPIRECCETVISAIDDNGYLTSHSADLAMVSGEPVENGREVY